MVPRDVEAAGSKGKLVAMKEASRHSHMQMLANLHASRRSGTFRIPTASRSLSKYFSLSIVLSLSCSLPLSLSFPLALSLPLSLYLSQAVLRELVDCLTVETRQTTVVAPRLSQRRRLYFVMRHIYTASYCSVPKLCFVGHILWGTRVRSFFFANSATYPDTPRIILGYVPGYRPDHTRMCNRVPPGSYPGTPWIILGYILGYPQDHTRVYTRVPPE